MISPGDTILIIGAGSIGERYIRNLWSLGYFNIVVLRQRNLPFREIGSAKPLVVTSWEQIEAAGIKAAIVCTPTAFHLDNALDCIKRGIPTLVEKPLSHSINGLLALSNLADKQKVLVQVGYMMRFHPLLIKVREIVNSKKFGNLVHIDSFWGEYLPDWHPWENYRESYAARKELGGGVALTLSHDLDLSNWIAGSKVVEWQSLFNWGSSLEVDVESGADFLIHYGDGITAHVHLNFYQKAKERYYKYILDDAVIKVDFFKSEMVISTSRDQTIDRLDNFDRNQLFISQIENFFSNLPYPEMSRRNIAESKEIIEMCHPTK